MKRPDLNEMPLASTMIGTGKPTINVSMSPSNVNTKHNSVGQKPGGSAGIP